jgi:hypothetical protein
MYALSNTCLVACMPVTANDIVPLSQVRARFTELAEAADGGEDKLVTRNGASYVAIIGARKLDYYRRLEREHLHLLLLTDAEQGLDDIESGRVSSLGDLARELGR